MAEIKSTLDLVMEKTRNLSLSSEERKEQKDKEIDNRIRGLLQKFIDQTLGIENFKSEYQKLQKDYDLSGNVPLIKTICDRIELGKDNQALFDLLAESKVSDFEGIKSILQKFQTASDAAARERSKILKEQLAQTHFISGSAVVPNLEKDDDWRKEAGEIRAKYGALLDKEKARLLAESSAV
ncbi:MAG: hypothetical protein V2I56_12285 [Desulfobacteraceae bacterium]|jgi:hypothetical protein|nr:hypothetical protein [Desulfobacteraceae bacterium]